MYFDNFPPRSISENRKGATLSGSCTLITVHRPVPPRRTKKELRSASSSQYSLLNSIGYGNENRKNF